MRSFSVTRCRSRRWTAPCATACTARRPRKNVRAKTGSLRYVNTLSGYVTTAAGERLAFSLMLNNYGGTTARADLDAIAVQLAGFTGRSL